MLLKKAVDKLKKVEHGCFFTDNERRVDYVFVIEKKTETLTTYLLALEKRGLEMEIYEKPTSNISFILLHLPKERLENYSKIYGVGQEIPITYKPKKHKWLTWWNTKLDIPVKQKGEFNTGERIMIVNKVLDATKFGPNWEDVGLNKLIYQQVLKDAYPLHDGSAISDVEALRQNDRRLLRQHWATFNCWYKKVPLDLVQRYFGCEIAFYFAWLEFFNIMLLPVAIIGLLVFIINLIIFNTTSPPSVTEVCEAHGMYVCPPYPIEKYINYKPVSHYCFDAKANFLFDNYLAIVFAFLMSFWGTLFLNLWRRKENYLKMKWSVQYVSSEECKIRRQYIEELKKRKLKRRPDGLIPFLPQCVTFLRLVGSIAACALLILLVVLVVIVVMLLKTFIKWECSLSDIAFFKHGQKHISLVCGCTLQVIIIKIFNKIYAKISFWLTDFENPRTQPSYDNSVTYKSYILSFVNNYAILFYIAFFKGTNYKLPFRNDSLKILEADTCSPTNCIYELCVQLAFLMLLKKFIGNVLTLIILNIRTRKGKIVTTSDVPQYEEDFALLPTNRYMLTSEFCEIVIVFGYVTFFVAAFPLAPLCALLNNLLEHRLDAIKLVTKYRRPVPRIVPGIGSWEGIMLGVTYLSAATNAFVIGFTSDFIWRILYGKIYSSDLKGYINSTLSAFDPKDEKLFMNVPPNPDICYYKDKRYPPGSPNKYEHTTDYWINSTWRLICILIFEHLVLILNGVLAYSIQELPKPVKERMAFDRYLIKEEKLKTVTRNLLAREKGRKEKQNWMML